MPQNGETNQSDGIVQNIVKNYMKIEQSIVSQLGLYYKNHHLNTGSSREDIWLQLFQMIVPKKFVIEHSVFIIDSAGNVSKEVDLAIIDNTYTPYIFQYGRLKFIPIEAVAAVVECKSSALFISAGHEGKEYKGIEAESEVKPEAKGSASLNNWYESIRRLRTSEKSIVRTATGIVIDGKINGQTDKKPVQTSTRPIYIFCGYGTRTHIRDIKSMFDFVLIADGESEKIDVSVCSKSLYEWYLELNHYGTRDEGEKLESCKRTLKEKSLNSLEVKYRDNDRESNVSLLTFNFQLNQLLMLINNPILFPHEAYAEMFRRGGNDNGGNKA